MQTHESSSILALFGRVMKVGLNYRNGENGSCEGHRQVNVNDLIVYSYIILKNIVLA